MNKKVILFGLFFVGFKAFATCSNVACNGKVIEFYLRDSDDIYVMLDQDLEPLDCTPHGNKYLTIIGTHKNSSNIYAALLATKAQNTEVKFRIRQGTPNCAIDYIQVFK